MLSAQSGDNEVLRDQADFLHHCYRDRSVTVNPIVEWNDRDVWAFLKHYGCDGNPLYHCGESRVGCIGCPLSQQKNMRKDFAKYPKYKQNYIAAFQRMLKAREESGLENKQNWKDGADVMAWWVGEDRDQLTLFTEEEILDIMADMV